MVVGPGYMSIECATILLTRVAQKELAVGDAELETQPGRRWSFFDSFWIYSGYNLSTIHTSASTEGGETADVGAEQATSAANGVPGARQ